MKSAAERQKLARERKKASGEKKQINVWISADAYRALVELAERRQINRTDLVSTVLLESLALSSATASRNAAVPLAETAISTAVKSDRPDTSRSSSVGIFEADSSPDSATQSRHEAVANDKPAKQKAKKATSNRATVAKPKSVTQSQLDFLDTLDPEQGALF